MIFFLFYNYPFKRNAFLTLPRYTITVFARYYDIFAYLSKKYNENHGGRTILTIRKRAIKLTTPHDSTATVDVIDLMGHSE